MLGRQTALFRGHTIVPNLSDKSIVCDFGANRADFSVQIIRRFGCRCYAVEPNKDLILGYPSLSGLRVFNYALGGANGQTMLKIGEDCESSSIVAAPSAQSGEQLVEVRTLGSFLDEQSLDHVDLAKFDIEGAEIPVFDNSTDATLLRFAQITIEFHDFNGWVAPAEVHRILRRFAELGFLIFRMTRTAHGDVLLVNRKSIPLGFLQRSWVRAVEKNIRGVRRQLIGRLRR